MTNAAALNSINKLIDKLCYRAPRFEVLADVFELSAIALSNQFDHRHPVYTQRETRYLEIIKKYSADEQKLFPQIFSEIAVLLIGMVDHGFDDYLGELYMLSRTSNSRTGQFFTPFHLSQACAMLSIDEAAIEETIAKDGIVMVNEPACGSGGMILACADAWHKRGYNYANHMFVECSDIDQRCIHMCYLQLALAGIPAVIYRRNTLTLETWEEWHTPALCMNWIRFRNCIYKGKG